MPAVANKQLDRSAHAAQEVLLDIVALKGGRFEGKQLLYKAFYLAHLYFYARYEGVLTDYPIVRMPMGPGIDRGDDLLADLTERELLGRSFERVGPYPAEVYTLLAPRAVDMADPRQDAIRSALEFIGDKTAAQVSEEIHEYSRTWKETASGSEQSIYLDLLSDDEMEQVRASGQAAHDAVVSVFGE